MICALKKTCVAITIALITAIAQIHGNYDTEPEYPCSGVREEKGEWFFNADLLCWKAFNSFTLNSSGGALPATTVNIFAGDRHFRWNTGFRIGIGYDFTYESGYDWGTTSCDECNFVWRRWSVKADWTHFQSHTHEQLIAVNSNAHWKLNFNVIDATLGREFLISPCFALQPFGGIRAVQIEQKLHVLSMGVGSRDNFLGIGPEMGVDLDCGLGYGFSLYGNATIAVLYGHFNAKHNQSAAALAAASLCQNKHKRDFQPVFDAAIGVQWNKYFCDDSLYLTLKLGYEHHRFFGHGHSLINSCSNLALDGWNFSADVHF